MTDTPRSATNRLPAQILVFTLARVVFNSLHRMIYPFLPVFGRGLGVSLETLAGVITLRSAVGAVAPLVGALSDQYSRKLGMLFSVALFIAGGGVVVIWPTLPGFVIALLLSMLGKYLFDPAMQAYLSDRVAYRQRGRVLAVTEIGWSLAFIAGVPFAGFLIARFGWQAPFPVFAGLGVLIFLALNSLIPPEAPGGVTPTLAEGAAFPAAGHPAPPGRGRSLSSGAGGPVHRPAHQRRQRNHQPGFWRMDGSRLRAADCRAGRDGRRDRGF